MIKICNRVSREKKRIAIITRLICAALICSKCADWVLITYIVSFLKSQSDRRDYLVNYRVAIFTAISCSLLLNILCTFCIFCFFNFLVFICIKPDSSCFLCCMICLTEHCIILFIWACRFCII